MAVDVLYLVFGEMGVVDMWGEGPRPPKLFVILILRLLSDGSRRLWRELRVISQRRPCQVSFACITAIAAFILWGGSASASGPLRPFKHGFWQGGAFTDDLTGVFTHCSAGVGYSSGLGFFVLASRDNRWWLGFAAPQWSLPGDRRVSVQLRFDNGVPLKLLSTISQGKLIVIKLPDGPHQISSLRHASKLNAVIEGRTLAFNLTEVSAVMDQLTSCVQTSIALGVHGAPAATGSASSGVSNTGTASFNATRSSEPSAPTAPPTTDRAASSSSPAPITALTEPEAHHSPSPQPAATPMTRGSPGPSESTVWPWISVVVVGALMGVLGQAICALLGLKKAGDAASLHGIFLERIEFTRLTISLFIGAVAGMIAAIAITPGSPMSREALLSLAAAGYAGADFVEGLMARYLQSPLGSRAPMAASVEPIVAMGERS